MTSRLPALAAAFSIAIALRGEPAIAQAPAMHELALDSHGSRLNGLIYLAAGGGPHPIVAFLHGFPVTNSASRWDYITQAPRIRDHAVLRVSGTRDSPDENPAMHRRLEEALRASGAKRVRVIVYDDDHPFSAHRLQLADALVSWLKTDCAATQAR